jgi:hypothetical protein
MEETRRKNERIKYKERGIKEGTVERKEAKKDVDCCLSG